MRAALERRARLVEQQAVTVRRRSARVLSHVAVFVAFDAVAFVAARPIATALFEPIMVPADSSSAVIPVGPLAAPGAPASLVFPIVLFVALILAGSYTRRRAAVIGLRLIAATMAAGVATAVTLATLVGVRNGLVHAGAFGLVCFAALAAGRALAESFAALVWPRDRGALAAVRLSVSSVSTSPQPRSWGDYVFVDEVRLRNESAASHLPATLQNLHELALRGVEALIIDGDLPDHQLMLLVNGALDLGYRIIYPARAVPMDGIRPRLVWRRGAPFFEISTPVLRASAILIKRVTDVLGGALLLVLTSPLMALIAVAIRLDSAGPVFFTQDRAGLGGRRFRMLKFRTMAVGADEKKHELSHLNRSGDGRLFKIPGDPRVTRVGRLLRRWSLDELPQVINVLKGDMSLVGPRPFFESDFSAYEDRHFRRLDTKPGITGLWQVSGRSDLVEFDDVVFLDRQYIEQWSLWLDLSILARTVPAVLRRHGAY